MKTESVGVGLTPDFVYASDPPSDLAYDSNLNLTKLEGIVAGGMKEE